MANKTDGFIVLNDSVNYVFSAWIFWQSQSVLLHISYLYLINRSKYNKLGSSSVSNSGKVKQIVSFSCGASPDEIRVLSDESAFKPLFETCTFDCWIYWSNDFYTKWLIYRTDYLTFYNSMDKKVKITLVMRNIYTNPERSVIFAEYC